MSNNKFYFKFKKRTPKIQDSHSKKKLQLSLNSKVYTFYLFEKKISKL